MDYGAARQAFQLAAVGSSGREHCPEQPSRPTGGVRGLFALALRVVAGREGERVEARIHASTVCAVRRGGGFADYGWQVSTKSATGDFTTGV